MKLSIIIPAYNEETRIAKTLENYTSFFNKTLKDYEIIVVLNGCVDNTFEIVSKISKKNKTLNVLEFKEKIGKGSAIKQGFKIAKGDLIGFVDADSSTSPEEFLKLYNNISDYDGIIASRWMKGSVISKKQPFLRIIFGRVFNFIVNILFGFHYKDTQCGAKLFKKNAVEKIIDNIGLTKWAFDIDVLYLMKRNKFRIIEFPTTWGDSPESKLKLWKTVKQMALSVVRLRLYYSPFKFIAKAIDRILKL